MKRGEFITQAVNRAISPAAPLRDSGIPWLGRIPAHWEVPALKFRYTVELGKMLDEKRITGNHLVPYLRNVDVQWDNINYQDLPLMDITEDEYARYTNKENDVLVCEGGEVGRAAVVGSQAGVHGFQKALHRLRAESEHELPRFIFYTLLWAVNTGVFSVEGSSTIAHLTADQLRRYRFPKPPMDEQIAIAAYLDWKTGQIDALIARKNDLLEKLKEKRLAVITQAVTRGLNPAAPVRDSGIPWLGHVPAHWELCQLKRKFRSVEYGISEALGSEGEVAILRMGNIENGKLVLNGLKFIDSVPDVLLLKRGDLLYNRTNSLELIGKVGMFTGESEMPVSFASYLVRIRVEEECLPEYFAYLLNTEGILGVARSHAFVAIGQCNLNPTRYGQIKAVIPPKSEQQSIVRFLDKETGLIDALVHKVQSVIDRLTEYRTALITAATTGKVDVRGIKIPNPVQP